MKNKCGFTLMEIIIAIAIIGLIAAFAVPSFDKSVRKADERSALLQLKKIHGRNLIELKRTGHCVAGIVAASSSGLEDEFGISYSSMEYSYSCNRDGTYTATAAHDQFTLQVTEDNLSDEAGSANPCCASAGCLITPAC